MRRLILSSDSNAIWRLADGWVGKSDMVSVFRQQIVGTEAISTSLKKLAEAVDSVSQKSYARPKYAEANPSATWLGLAFILFYLDPAWPGFLASG